jgi:hypothetical protein
MDEAGFQKALGDIMKLLGALTPEQLKRLENVMGQSAHQVQQTRKAVADMQESLDTIRLSVKYLLFDLEATRRENQYLRRMLKKNIDGE